MRNQVSRLSTVFLFCLLSLLLIGLPGCGGDESGPNQGNFELLQPDLQTLNARLQTHYDSVGKILGLPMSGPAAMEAGDFATQLIDDDWADIQRETDEYGQEMHRILDDLGEKVTMVGACEMQMGGMMIGPHGGGSCLCQPYMDRSTEELQDHLSLMRSWTSQHDQDRLWEEMDRHMEQMGSRIRSMATHMKETYGTAMGHEGGMM